MSGRAARGAGHRRRLVAAAASLALLAACSRALPEGYLLGPTPETPNVFGYRSPLVSDYRCEFHREDRPDGGAAGCRYGVAITEGGIADSQVTIPCGQALALCGRPVLCDCSTEPGRPLRSYWITRDPDAGLGPLEFAPPPSPP